MRIRAQMFVGLLVILSSSLAAQDRPPGPPTVETTGIGERRVVPDRAAVQLTITSKAISAAAAAAANAKTSQAVRDTLRAMGLDSVVSVSSYSVSPNYEPGPRGEGEIRGYVANTTVRVRLTKMDLVGRVIDAGLAKGGTGVNVGFEASTAESVRREALADAASKAKLDAEALARALGGTLGTLVSTSTNFNDPRMYQISELSMARVAGGTAAVPNEILIRASVLTRWQFVPKP